MLGRAQDLLYPFLYGEQRGFAGVFDYGNNYPIEQFRAPLDNVCVTEGNGVKAAWIDCNHEFGSTKWEGVGEYGIGPERENGGVGKSIILVSVLIRVVPSFCQLSTVNCQLSTVNCQLSTDFYFLIE